MTHSDRFPTRRAPLLSVLLALIASIGCGGGDLPSGWASSPAGSGPRIVWDLAAEPLPEIPLPNDLATWPDPTSPTGLRINASMVAPTEMEETTRSYFDELDGWSVQAPITMAFEAPIDVERLIDAQGGARFDGIDWPRHAIYLVNLETGVPVPIEINGGNFHFALRDTRAYWDNDSRAGESNIFFETVEEDRDGDGVLDPGEDTDFDGVLDHPNTIDGALIDPSDPTETVDRLLWFYERETNTLIMRPIMPLAPRTQYAMVVTNRLVGEGGSPVRSPFDQVHHVGQYEALAGLKSIFDAHPEIYGGLDWPGVAFAWTFTTQSTTEDLWTLREGLYGRGSMAHLAEAFPPHFLTAEARRGNASFPCDPGARSYTVTMDEIRPVLDTVGQEAFGVSATQMAELLATYDNVSHFVVGYVETPYLLGDPKADHPYERWRFDRQTGEARLDRDRIPVIVTVPKETPEYQQPFPVVFYGHGYTSMMIESIGFAGLMARHGLATVGIDAQAHGLGMDAILESVLTNVFAGACLDGMGEMIKTDRAIDHNGDGIKDSAGIYWSAYVFHTRDVTRQSVLDHMQVIRTFRHFGGRPGEEPPLWEPAEIIPENPRAEPLRFSGDVDGDGERDLAGDFDGDGRIDFGGWDNQYYAWGQSLGGILSGLLSGAEPALTAAAPTAGACGLTEVGARTTQGGVREAVILRMIGPLVVSRPASSIRAERTDCADGESSLRFVVPDVNSDVGVEFACLPAERLAEGNVVIIRNLINREARCAATDAEGRIRVGLPSDVGDLVHLEIYEGGADRIRFGDECAWTGEPPPLLEVVDEFGVSGLACEECANYQGRRWEIGDPLEMPTEGFGLARQTPRIRRFLGLAQAALDPGDPAPYMRHIFLDPLAAEDVNGGAPTPRSILVVNTVGDMNVPISAGNACGRMAGITPFMPPSAPDAFHEMRAPASFGARYGVPSPNDLYVMNHIHEGVARLGRHPVPGGPAEFLFDIEDFSDGAQWFAADGRRQLAPGGDPPAYQPLRMDPPLRWVRASRAMDGPSDTSVFDPAGIVAGGVSSNINPYIRPYGQHGFDLIDGRKVWDEGVYMTNLIAWYFASRGTDLLFHSDPAGHRCLEDSSCLFGF